MKFTLITDLLAESGNEITLTKGFEADMLKDGKMLDALAEKVQGQGFPEKFSLPVKLSTGADIVLEYELYEKAINDEKGHHTLTFTYEYTRETVIKTRALLKDAEKDEADDEGEKYDQLYEELKHDMIHIMAEFTDKFQKVWGSVK
jgi:hypothetical protein